MFDGAMQALTLSNQFRSDMCLSSGQKSRWITLSSDLEISRFHSLTLWQGVYSGWSRTTVSCAAISHLPFTFLSTIRMRPSTVTPALVA